MLRRYSSEFKAALMVVDMLSALALLYGLSALRFDGDLLGALRPIVQTPSLAAVVYAAAWPVALALCGLYRPRARWSFGGEAEAVVTATVIFAGATLAALVLFRTPEPSRLVLISLFPLLASVAVALRATLRVTLTLIRARGGNSRNVLILGTGEWAQDFATKLETQRGLGLRVLGFLGDGGPRVPKPWSYLGGLDRLEDVLHELVVDEVAICLPLHQWTLVEPITSLCEEEGKIVRLPLGLPHRAMTRARIEELEGIPVFSLVNGPDRGLALAAKRALDILGAVVGLMAFSPLLVAIAALIRWREGAPVFFRQERVGLHGRTFEIVKFRTMVPDAEARYSEVVALSDPRAFKLAADPRITPLGAFLRKTSIDELPQLWNVLKGEMSLIGPRPAPPREVGEYDIWHRRRLSMKPGISGLWQVAARRDEDFDNRASLDMRYIDGWSIWLDLKVIARTIPAMFQGR